MTLLQGLTLFVRCPGCDDRVEIDDIKRDEHGEALHWGGRCHFDFTTVGELPVFVVFDPRSARKQGEG